MYTHTHKHTQTHTQTQLYTATAQDMLVLLTGSICCYKNFVATGNHKTITQNLINNSNFCVGDP